MVGESLTRRVSHWLNVSKRESRHHAYIPLSNVESVSQTSPVSIAIDEGAGTTHVQSENAHEDEKDTADGSDTGGQDSSESPTAEENVMLRRVVDDIPLAAFTIVIVELCERFAFYGLSGVFQNYLQNPLPIGGKGTGAPASVNDPVPAGALNLGQSTASGLQQVFSAFAYVFPLFGAIIADTKWGRYKTITVFCAVYFVGLFIITASSFPFFLRVGLGLPGWLFGAFIVAVGTGGIKANVSPLVADQYRKTDMFIRTINSGERVIVDPSLTISRIYNLFYWCINVGSLSAIVTTQLERRVGFWAAFTLPTCVFVATPLVLISGSKLYYKVAPRGSIIVEVYRVVRLAFKGLLTNPVRFLREARTTGIWNRAKPSLLVSSDDTQDKNIGTSMITWDDSFVDEVKRTARACQIALFFPLYWVAYNQITTNLVSMAATMSTNGTPNDLLANFNPITLIILLPTMDVIVYPSLRRIGIVLRPIFRIWLGFMFAALAMVYSAVLQHFIYSTNPCGEYVGTCAQPSSIIVWVQVPSYVLIAISEIFASVSGLEYAYSESPKGMKSIVMSFFLLMSAVGSVINAFLAPFAQDPNLVRNYTGIALATFVAGNLFYLCFWRRDRNEEYGNAIEKWNPGLDSQEALNS
ncbi:PTR2-domain-containing protein [Phellopilus nigrolimitatus]|nr:PTR2-domain-containing protein [Phellopilus nigrolimitatus]